MWPAYGSMVGQSIRLGLHIYPGVRDLRQKNESLVPDRHLGEMAIAAMCKMRSVSKELFYKRTSKYRYSKLRTARSRLTILAGRPETFDRQLEIERCWSRAMDSIYLYHGGRDERLPDDIKRETEAAARRARDPDGITRETEAMLERYRARMSNPCKLLSDIDALIKQQKAQPRRIAMWS